jgi:predicted aminopeptidase
MRPITEVRQDPRTSTRIRDLLGEVPDVKKFGEAHGLKHTSNYTQYVALDRPVATWVLSACDPVAFKPRSWRFPLVGGFTYLGWFDREGAERYGADLEREEGLDVDLRGAAAYSTLGWFTDPVYSPMLREGDDALGSLIDTVLHEGVHDTLYVDGESYFNESLAVFVGDGLTQEYFAQAGPRLASAAAAWKRGEAEFEERGKAMHETYVALEALYASKRPRVEILAEKAAHIGKLEGRLHLDTSKRWRRINNATLIQYKTYRSGMEAFSRLFKACSGDYPRFLAALKPLKPSDFAEEQAESFDAVVDKIAQAGCRSGSI